jgi:small-conductance mechanosensitive channel
VIASRLRIFTQKTASIWDDVGCDLIEGLKSGVVFVWIFYLLAKSLETTPFMHKLILIAVVSLSILQVGLWGSYLIRKWRDTSLNRRIERDPSSAAALGLLYTAIQTIFIIIIVLIGLSNIGVDIGALIAGLGVGGIAVALAAQNILGDLLASLSIVLDRPFVVGDYIVAGGEQGTIEQIGIKTTRVRSLSGEEIILANKYLLESQVHNFKRMSRRRVVQKFGVVYSTPLKQIEAIPGWVTEIVRSNDKLDFDRCHFSGLGASSLDFELVFYVNDPEYNVSMDLQQKILLTLCRKFESENVEFAFPTQTIRIEQQQHQRQNPAAYPAQGAPT